MELKEQFNYTCNLGHKLSIVPSSDALRTVGRGGGSLRSREKREKEERTLNGNVTF